MSAPHQPAVSACPDRPLSPSGAGAACPGQFGCLQWASWPAHPTSSVHLRATSTRVPQTGALVLAPEARQRSARSLCSVLVTCLTRARPGRLLRPRRLHFLPGVSAPGLPHQQQCRRLPGPGSAAGGTKGARGSEHTGDEAPGPQGSAEGSAGRRRPSFRGLCPGCRAGGRGPGGGAPGRRCQAGRWPGPAERSWPHAWLSAKGVHGPGRGEGVAADLLPGARGAVPHPGRALVAPRTCPLPAVGTGLGFRGWAGIPWLCILTSQSEGAEELGLVR